MGIIGLIFVIFTLIVAGVAVGTVVVLCVPIILESVEEIKDMVKKIREKRNA